MEVLCTLRALLGNLGGGKVLLYPQLLLGALALLCSSVVRVGEVAMHILLQVRTGTTAGAVGVSSLVGCTFCVYIRMELNLL